MTPEQQAQATDFNDLHRAADLDAVRSQIGNALENFTTGVIPQDEPQPDDGERQQRTGKREKPPIKPAKAYSIADFLSIKLPPRINLLSPWMPAQGLAMVYAPRGIGKTFFGLNVAYAVASGGSFLCWKAEAPMRVMYIDGEMPAVTMQERLASIVNSHEAEAADDALLIVTEWNEFRHPDFDQIKKRLKKPVIFDGRNLFDPEPMSAKGFTYFGVGRGRSKEK